MRKTAELNFDTETMRLTLKETLVCGGRVLFSPVLLTPRGPLSTALPRPWCGVSGDQPPGAVSGRLQGSLLGKELATCHIFLGQWV